MKWKLLVKHETVQTQAGLKQSVVINISLTVCGMGKQVVGLKGNSNRETKVKCQHSSAELAKFLWMSAAVCLPHSL